MPTDSKSFHQDFGFHHSLLLVMKPTTPGWNCLRKPKRKYGDVILAAAKVSVDAAVVAVLLELDGILVYILYKHFLSQLAREVMRVQC